MKNESERTEERLFEGLEPPPPLADLRLRALGAARERMSQPPVPDLWSKIWNGRGFRLAWAAVVVLLLAGHVLVSPNPGTTNAPVLADDQRDEQFLDILRPVELDANAHPAIGRFAAATAMAEIEHGGNPS